MAGLMTANAGGVTGVERPVQPVSLIADVRVGKELRDPEEHPVGGVGRQASTPGSQVAQQARLDGLLECAPGGHDPSTRSSVDGQQTRARAVRSPGSPR